MSDVPTARFARKLFRFQSKQGFWSGSLDNDIGQKGRDRNRMVYTTQVLRCVAALGLSAYPFVQSAVKFVGEFKDPDPMYRAALKVLPLLELGEINRAIQAGSDLANRVPESGFVQFSGRADDITFSHLLSGQTLAALGSYRTTQQSIFQRKADRIARALEKIHQGYFRVADDPSQWIWYSSVMKELGRPIPERTTREIINVLMELKGNSTLWQCPRWRKRNSVAPVTQSAVVVTCHILENLARISDLIGSEYVDDMVVSPLLELFPDDIDTIPVVIGADGTRYVGDLYVHALACRTLVLCARAYSHTPVLELAMRVTGIDYRQFWELPVTTTLPADSYGDTQKDHVMKAKELVKKSPSLDQLDAKIEKLLTIVQDDKHMKKLEFQVPLIPHLLYYKWEKKL